MAITIADLIKERYPDIEWDKFEDADRALNWELWHGTLPDNYWTYVEPLEHYVWRGFEIAVGDIEEILSPLPHEMWYDADCDYLTENDPEDIDENWEYIEDEDGNVVDALWLGGYSWEKINLRQKLMYEESWKQVF